MQEESIPTIVTGTCTGTAVGVGVGTKVGVGVGTDDGLGVGIGVGEIVGTPVGLKLSYISNLGSVVLLPNAKVVKWVHSHVTLVGVYPSRTVQPTLLRNVSVLVSKCIHVGIRYGHV